MKLASCSLVAAAVLMTLAGTVHAQIIPVDITSGSFTDDIILAGGSDGVTNNVQGGGGPSTPGYDYASQTYATAHSFSGTALPDNGTIASGTGSGAVFQLQPYTQNNAAIVAGTSSTLTLATPSRYNTISFLLNNTSANAPATFTLNFAGGSTDTVTTTQNVPYWVGGVPVANEPTEFAGVAAVYQPLEYGGGQDGTPINFDEYTFYLSNADKGKTLDSITVNGASQTLDVFAVSGEAPAAAPEPSTWALMGLGSLVLAWRLRRKSALARV